MRTLARRDALVELRAEIRIGLRQCEFLRRRILHEVDDIGLVKLEVGAGRGELARYLSSVKKETRSRRAS